MATEREKYNKYIDELVKGLLRENKKQAKKLGFNYKKLYDIIKEEITFSEFLTGLKVKTIKVNGMVYSRKTKFYEPVNFKPPTEIQR